MSFQRKFCRKILVAMLHRTFDYNWIFQNMFQS